jgi:hypothetical protein
MKEEFKPTGHSEQFGDKYEHPSFGTIAFSRTQGCNVPLFGSSIEHHNTIRLIVSHAELNRDLQRDWIFSRGTIVEVDMSPTQFADAITGLNSSEIPVTIRYIQNGQRIPDPPYQNKVKQFNKEFQDDINKLSKSFDEAINLAKETKAQKRLIQFIEGLKIQFKNNLPFVNESFSEQMEKTITETKGEIDAFIDNKIVQYGLDAIKIQAHKYQRLLP